MKNIIFIILLFIADRLLSQTDEMGMGIGTLTPNQFAMLDIVSPTKGILIPRMSAEECANLQTMIESNMIQVNGLLVFNQDSLWFQFWKSNSWVPLISEDTDSDEQDLMGAILTNGQLQINIENGNSTSVDLSPLVDHDFHEVVTDEPSNNITNDIYTSGRVGVGTNTPQNQLHVASLDDNDAVRIDGLQVGNLNNNIIVTNINGELKNMPSEKYINSVCPYTPPSFFSEFDLFESDVEFDGNGPLMDLDVSLEWNSEDIWYHIEVTLTETESNYTVAKIITDFVVYKVPNNYEIQNVISGYETHKTATFDDHDEWIFQFSENGLVRYWTVVGDSPGSDIFEDDTNDYEKKTKTWTELVFNSMTIFITPE